MLCKSCSSSQRPRQKQSIEKLGLQFLDFSTILYGFYNLQAKHKKRGRIIFHKSLEPFNFTTLPSALTHRTLQGLGPHTTTLGGGAELAAGEGRPELANKWPEAVIGLIRDRLAKVARPVMPSVSGGGGTGAVRPRRREVRRGNRWGWAMCGAQSF
jgi:hypothetical protein